MKNCQIIICPIYKMINPLVNCGEFEGVKASFLACLSCEMMLLSYWKWTVLISLRYALRRGNLDYTNSSSALSILKLLYNWSGLALVYSLARGALLHDQGWRFGSVSAEGQQQRLQRRLKQRAANYRHVVHHSSHDIPSETHMKGGLERLYRPRDNNGRHLRGDDVS